MVFYAISNIGKEKARVTMYFGQFAKCLLVIKVGNVHGRRACTLQSSFGMCMHVHIETLYPPYDAGIESFPS